MACPKASLTQHTLLHTATAHPLEVHSAHTMGGLSLAQPEILLQTPGAFLKMATMYTITATFFHVVFISQNTSNEFQGNKSVL